MRLEYIDRVAENDVLGKSILTDDGQVLLRSGVKMSSSYINKLKALGVFYIYIEDDRLNDIFVEDERLNELKKNTIKNISSVIKNLTNNNSADFKDSLSKVEELVDYLIEDGDVNKSLYDVKTHDNYTFLHCIDTGIMATFLGMSMGFNEQQLKDLSKSAILHDIGKINIDNKIINKETMLTPEEFEEMKKHPSYGAEILKKSFLIPDSVITAVEQHHERVDGRGYPKALDGKAITKYAKIVSVCDVYDAVSNDRSYRKKFTPNAAYELILSGCGSAFDEEIVRKFRETFSVYPLGCCLRLSNGVEGYVIKQNSNFPDRPVLRILYEGEEKKPITFYEIDLLENLSLTVECVI